jgi:hypothetical protein
MTAAGPERQGTDRPSSGHVLKGLALSWLAVAAVSLAYHRALLAWMRAKEQWLSTITAGMVVPLHARWERQWPGLWLVPAVVAVGLFLACVPLLLDRRLPAARFLPLAVGFFLAVGLSVSMIDGMQGKPGELQQPGFVMPLEYREHDYFGDVPLVRRLGVKRFVESYARPRVFQRLTTHSRTHPPGPAVLHWLVRSAFGYDPWVAATALVSLSTLAIPLLYLLGVTSYGEEVARYGVLIWVVTPAVNMETITSMDGVFTVLALLTIWPFARWRREPRRRRWPLLAGACLGLGTFMTYSFVFLPVLMALMVALGGPRDRRRLARAVGLATAGFMAVQLALVLGLGHHPLAALRASMAHNTALVGTGRETVTRYLNLSLAQVMAFSIGLGVPVGAAWLGGVAAALRSARRAGIVDAVALGVTATILIMAFSSLFSLEVERVWLFMMPLVALVAGQHLHSLESAAGTRAPLYATLGVSSVELLLAETCLYTMR